MTIKECKAYQYAKWCIKKNNKYVGVYVKKQAKRWIDIVDSKSKDAYVCEKSFNLIIKILQLMNHPDLHCSMLEGIEDYAWFLIIAIFCTKNTEDKSRYYETALLEICRKNFKTFNSAVIFIIGMLTEKQFSRFFSVAPDYKLSSELKLAVRKIIKVSPALIKHFKINRDMITCKLKESEYIPLAYSNDNMDGKLADMFLADEAGALDAYPVEAMRSSQITLSSKLGIIISTQYPNDNNVMVDEIDYAKKVLDNLIDDPHYFSLLYEPNEDIAKKWETDDLVIYQSNPVAYSNKKIFNAIKKKRVLAVLYENKRENYLCKHNNIQYKGLGTEGYVEVTKVRECKIAENLEFWIGKRVYLGLDLSQTDDNTAVAMVTYFEGKIYSKVFGFIPADRLVFKTQKEHVDYTSMIKKGYCFACGDEVIDYGFIESFILSVEKKYGVEVVQVGYDRYNATSTVQKLEGDMYNPLECVEIKQHSSVLHPATKLLKEFILSKTFRYEANILLEINFQNARCTEDTNLNKYVNKKRSKGKVDLVVALINAIHLLNVNEILSDSGNWGVQT